MYNNTYFSINLVLKFQHFLTSLKQYVTVESTDSVKQDHKVHTKYIYAVDTHTPSVSSFLFSCPLWLAAFSPSRG